MLIAVFLSIGAILYSCNKSDLLSQEKENNTIEKKSDLSSDPQHAFINKIQGNREMADKISKDSLWKNLKNITDEMTAILISNDIDLKDSKILDEKYFYRKLGKDADIYKFKFRTGKIYAEQLRLKYFSAYKVCGDCSTISPEKVSQYALKLDQLKANMMPVTKTTSVSTSSENNGPSCWNWQFFACGTICAATVEAPPLFALCMALCVDSYCNL